jgi:hypothetical protein
LQKPLNFQEKSPIKRRTKNKINKINQRANEELKRKKNTSEAGNLLEIISNTSTWFFESTRAEKVVKWMGLYAFRFMLCTYWLLLYSH